MNKAIKKTFLEEEYDNARDCMTALVFGHKLKEMSSGMIAYLSESGELITSSGEVDFDLGRWRSIAEVDWYALGELLADTESSPALTCTVMNEEGEWFTGVLIIGFLPVLNTPYVGLDKCFYSMAIIESHSVWLSIPMMEVS